MISALTLTTTSSCAVLGLDSDSSSSGQLSAQEEMEKYENDPVALAALRLRRPGDVSRSLAFSGASSAPSATSAEQQRTPASNRLTVGMSRPGVRALWGEPQEVESAGDPRQGNERWIYSSGLVHSSYGLSNRRVIYFERGKVVGWETLAGR